MAGRGCGILPGYHIVIYWKVDIFDVIVRKQRQRVSIPGNRVPRKDEGDNGRRGRPAAAEGGVGPAEGLKLGGGLSSLAVEVLVLGEADPLDTGRR